MGWYLCALIKFIGKIGLRGVFQEKTECCVWRWNWAGWRCGCECRDWLQRSSARGASMQPEPCSFKAQSEDSSSRVKSCFVTELVSIWVLTCAEDFDAEWLKTWKGKRKELPQVKRKVSLTSSKALGRTRCDNTVAMHLNKYAQEKKKYIYKSHG